MYFQILCVAGRILFLSFERKRAPEDPWTPGQAGVQAGKHSEREEVLLQFFLWLSLLRPQQSNVI